MSLETLRRRAWSILLAKIHEQTSDAAILSKLRNNFEEKFRYDAGGMPRVWEAGMDIEGTFKDAKDHTLALIPLYGKISPLDPDNEFSLGGSDSQVESNDGDSDLDFPGCLAIFSLAKQLDLETRFRKDADAYYVEAKRSTVSSVAQIPVWMYGVLVVLGWNEAMVVLFNPLYCALLLVLGAGGYLVLQLGLLGPILQISRTVAREVSLSSAFIRQSKVVFCIKAHGSYSCHLHDI